MASIFSDHLRYNLVRQESLKTTYNSILTKSTTTHKQLADKWFSSALRALECQAVDQEILMDDPTRDIDYGEVDDTEENLLTALDDHYELLLRSSGSELHDLLLKSVREENFIMIRLLLECVLVKNKERLIEVIVQAIEYNSLGALKLILQDDSIDVRAVDATKSLIKCAIRNHSSPEVFKMLLEDERIDPHSEKIRSWPHLYFIQQNNQEILRLFLDCERYIFQTPNNYIIKIINNGMLVEGSQWENRRECLNIFKNHPRVIAELSPLYPELFPSSS